MIWSFENKLVQLSLSLVVNSGEIKVQSCLLLEYIWTPAVCSSYLLGGKVSSEPKSTCLTRILTGSTLVNLISFAR